jgi:hypothetical protein
MPPKKTFYKIFFNSSQSILQTGKRILAYNPGFEQNLIKYNVYLYNYKYPDDRTTVKPEN